jgi:hypothetical protein
MDGRNLSSSIILKWTPLLSLLGVAKTIPVFIKKVLNAKDYEFYGSFMVNSVYELKNFNNMLVSNFPCKIDVFRDNKIEPLFYGDNGDFTLIISDDCFLLIKNFQNEKKEKKEEQTFGKIVFWSSLFAITDLQINKERKAVRIHFYSNDKQEEQLRLIIENVLFFKETLIKKMSNLKTEVEISKLMRGKYIENKISIRDINNMNIEQIEDGVFYFAKKIENNEVNFYIVDTFNALCSKVIEYYAKYDNIKQMEYIIKMKDILQNEKVKEILTQNKNRKKSLEN